MFKPSYTLFYDNHTMPSCPDVGKNFEVELFTDKIKECGVDFLIFHARCNMGNAYYDTEIGIKHPSLKYDLFGSLAEACEKKGIKLSAYLNAGLSHAEALLHMDWLRVNMEGKIYTEQNIPSFRIMCFNTPYREHLKAMTLEVAKKYPTVAGFFWDCMYATHHCICPVCVKEMKERGIDWQDPVAVKKFSRFSAIRIAEEISIELKMINPEYLLYFNGLGFEPQAKIGTYLECECLPTGGWGYEVLPLLSRYLRNFGKTVLNQTGRFHKSWGDFGGIRTEASLEYDLLYGLANGMRPSVGGHFHPRGDINRAVFSLIKKVYKKLQACDEWYLEAKPITEVAVFFSTDYDTGNTVTDIGHNVYGVVRMLCELKQQFDVVSEEHDWSRYKVLILPDNILMTDKIWKKVKAHLNAGKKIISSYKSGFTPDGKEFMFEKEWGTKFLKDNYFDPAFFIINGSYGKNLPDMPLSFYSKGIEMKAVYDTKSFGKIIKSFHNFGWDGEHTYFYAPPYEETDIPILTISKQVAHFSHPIFSTYYEKAPVPLRQLFANALDEFLPEPLLKTQNLPSFARAMVTEQPGKKMIHLLAYVPEKRGSSTEMIEEPITVSDATISLRYASKMPRKVYIAPVKKELVFRHIGNYIEIEVPLFKGYSLIVVEK